MKKSILRKLLPTTAAASMMFGAVQTAYSGTPVTGLLLCCRGNTTTDNRGPFLINNQWINLHNYGDINQVRGILTNIQNAGVNVVMIDMSNASQWTRDWNNYRPMVDNIRTVCAEKKMEYFILIGAVLTTEVRNELKGLFPYIETIGNLEFWNNQAKFILDNWAGDRAYRRYGFGNDKKVLNLFYPGELVFGTTGTGGIWGITPANQKNSLDQFYLGTHQYNQVFVQTVSDGWGYRDRLGNLGNTIRFVCPTKGLDPFTSVRRVDSSTENWSREIDWAKDAALYSIYGSYDDNFDNINWGITNTTTTSNTRYKYPNNEPYYYYNPLRDRLRPIAPWSAGDIGGVDVYGSANYIGDGTKWAITGSGPDIFGTADEFHYVHQPSTGDCSIQMRVASMTNSDQWAKAGLMIRETTASGSKNAMVCVTPGQGVNFQWRTSTNGATTNATQVTGQTAPKWLRLTRTGNSFAAFRSDNGTTWTQVGATKTISMDSSAKIGMAVTSHFDGRLCTANVESVSATP